MARCAGGQGEREARKTERHPTIADTRGRRVPSECGLVRVGNLAAAAFHVSPCVGILSLQRSRLFPLLHMTNPRPRGASHCENSACTGSKCRKVRWPDSSPSDSPAFPGNSLGDRSYGRRRVARRRRWRRFIARGGFSPGTGKGPFCRQNVDALASGS